MDIKVIAQVIEKLEQVLGYYLLGVTEDTCDLLFIVIYFSTNLVKTYAKMYNNSYNDKVLQK